MIMERNIFITLVLLLGVGCGGAKGPNGSADEGVTANRLSRTDDCKRTQCDDVLASSSSSGSATGWATCVTTVGSLDGCGSSTPVTCNQSMRDTCTDLEVTFTVVADPDPTDLANCQAAVARDQACQESYVAPDCDHYARLEDAAKSAAPYACYAQLPCGADPSSCDPQPGTLGDDVCGSLRALCNWDWCSDAWRVAINQQEPWLAADVAEALRACTREENSCMEARTCIQAFATAVFPSL
jgi:hypothetical protein